MRARILLLAVVSTLTAAGTARAAGDPIMPLAEVRPGMACTGYSVFRGTAVEPFGVEVVDVVGGNSTGDSAARILVRVSGANVDATGVGPGFSGSPIYCRGADGTARNIGAISETIGDYGGKTVLATPIEQILATPKGRSAKAAASRRAALPAGARPLAGPITVRGLSRGVYAALARAGARRGVTVLQAPAIPVTAPAPQPLVPGSAMSVGLSSGDIALGAVGTVAYVDGDRVWGFGHSFDGVGARSLLLQDAYVSTIVNNPLQLADMGGTYKLAGPVNDIGTITGDGFNGVVGRTGALPSLIPLRVYARDLDRDRGQDLLVRVADETDVGMPTGGSALSLAAPLAVAEGATAVLGAAPSRVAGDLCLRVVVRELPRPLRFCNRYVSDGTDGSSGGAVGNPVALSAANDVATAMGLLDSFKGRRLHVKEVSARIRQTRAQRQAYLLGVRLPPHVRAGSTVRGQFLIRVVGGRKRVVGFRFHIPRQTKPDAYRLAFQGHGPDGLEDLLGVIEISVDGGDSGNNQGPRTLGQLASAFRGLGRDDGIRLRNSGARVYRNPKLRIGGRARTVIVVHPARR